MSAYCPRSAAPANARAVASSPIGDEAAGPFQSDADFATAEKWLARAAWAARRADRVLIVIALSAALWAALPAICMALAGGTPA